jgi:hypothetical protein
MALCDGAHARYDQLAAGKIQVGNLPEWTRVQGRVAWSVVKGPYSQLPAAWQSFMRDAPGASVHPNGPPGDVYVCNPMDHQGTEESMLTLLYVPVE